MLEAKPPTASAISASAMLTVPRPALASSAAAFTSPATARAPVFATQTRIVAPGGEKRKGGSDPRSVSPSRKSLGLAR